MTKEKLTEMGDLSRLAETGKLDIKNLIRNLFKKINKEILKNENSK